MSKVTDIKTAIAAITDGSSILIGGFMCCGQTFKLIDALLEKGVKDLTVICNDAGYPGVGVGKLIEAGRVRCLIASHIGLNPIAGQKMNSGEMIVDLVPQGTLAERIRCKGAGLGGVLTPTGIGTEVEKDKKRLTVDGKDYLVEEALGADFAFIAADKADDYGNAFVAASRKNFNTFMATAARYTIVEAREIVRMGMMDPEAINIPSIFVKSVVRMDDGR